MFMAAPETAALTKFRASIRDYVHVVFYTKDEWKKLWDSRTSAADAFVAEYNELNADRYEDRWIGHEPIPVKNWQVMILKKNCQYGHRLKVRNIIL